MFKNLSLVVVGLLLLIGSAQPAQALGLGSLPTEGQSGIALSYIGDGVNVNLLATMAFSGSQFGAWADFAAPLQEPGLAFPTSITGALKLPTGSGYVPYLKGGIIPLYAGPWRPYLSVGLLGLGAGYSSGSALRIEVPIVQPYLRYISASVSSTFGTEIGAVSLKAGFDWSVDFPGVQNLFGDASVQSGGIFARLGFFYITAGRNASPACDHGCGTFTLAVGYALGTPFLP